MLFSEAIIMFYHHSKIPLKQNFRTFNLYVSCQNQNIENMNLRIHIDSYDSINFNCAKSNSIEQNNNYTLCIYR